jgi:hypothetical protein
MYGTALGDQKIGLKVIMKLMLNAEHKDADCIQLTQYRIEQGQF